MENAPVCPIHHQPMRRREMPATIGGASRWLCPLCNPLAQ